MFWNRKSANLNRKSKLFTIPHYFYFFSGFTELGDILISKLQFCPTFSLRDFPRVLELFLVPDLIRKVTQMSTSSFSEHRDPILMIFFVKKSRQLGLDENIFLRFFGSA